LARSPEQILPDPRGRVKETSLIINLLQSDVWESQQKAL
jgi:hypothetical protein